MMRGPSQMSRLRRRPSTATQVCTLPERPLPAAAFYEPPHGETPEARRASAANEDRAWQPPPRVYAAD